MFWSSKFWEVQKYLSVTRHAYTPFLVLYSKKLWDGLSKDEQAALRDCAVVARDEQRKVSRELSEASLNKIKGEGTVVNELPGDLAQLAASEPVYETLPGWGRPTRSLRSYDDLPEEAKAYIARIEEITGVPAAVLSTGSAREDTIIREGSIAAAWFNAR